VASIGVEQFGQREYAEQVISSGSGRPETTVIFSQDNPALVATAVSAVTAENLPRTGCATEIGQGRWASAVSPWPGIPVTARTRT
jgi:hypothetical protein